MPSQWVHARGQAHWVRYGGLRSLSLLVLLCFVSLALCPISGGFSSTNSSLHPPLCSLPQVLQVWQVDRGQVGREPLVDRRGTAASVLGSALLIFQLLLQEDCIFQQLWIPVKCGVAPSRALTVCKPYSAS